MVADFVVQSEDGSVLFIVESKVNSARFSSGQARVFVDGESATFIGKNAKKAKLTDETFTPDASNLKVFEWNSTTGKGKIVNPIKE